MIDHTNFTIRLMQPRDVATVAEIARATMPHSWSRAVFMDCLEGDYHAWVMQHGKLDVASAIVGFVVVLVQMEEGQLLKLVVRQRYHRQGLGKRLLAHAMTFMQQQAVNKVFLEVRASNHDAIAFYQSMQFDTVAKRKNYYPLGQQREDAVVMQWQPSS